MTTRARVYYGTPQQQNAAYEADRAAAAIHGWKPAQREMDKNSLRVIFEQPDRKLQWGEPVPNWPGLGPKPTPPPAGAPPAAFALSQSIASYVARGYRVQSQDQYGAVMVTGHRVNHVLHLILTILTGGLWLFVWIGLVILGGEKRTLLTVDDRGRVNERPA